MLANSPIQLKHITYHMNSHNTHRGVFSTIEPAHPYVYVLSAPLDHRDRSRPAVAVQEGGAGAGTGAGVRPMGGTRGGPPQDEGRCESLPQSTDHYRLICTVLSANKIRVTTESRRRPAPSLLIGCCRSAPTMFSAELGLIP